jgi:hypothetical protein
MSGDATKPDSGDVGLADVYDPTIPSEVVEIAENTEANPTADLVTVAVEATWDDALRRLGGAPSNPLPLWTTLATRILRAVANGECDPQRIKRIALDGLPLDRSSTDL